MEFKEKEIKRLTECKSFLKKINERLVNKVAAYDLGYKAKLPFEAISFHELLLHRTADLSETAINLFELKKLVPAIIMTRAVYETTAILNSLGVKIEEVIRTKNIENVGDFFMKSLFGGRIKEAPIESINILSAIDRITKRFKHIRESYDYLSEYAHPNWSGLMGSYGNLIVETATLHLGKEVSKISFMVALPLLAQSLAIFLHDYDEIKKQLPKFNNICEKSIVRKKKG
jgi:hypothetical protein